MLLQAGKKAPAQTNPSRQTPAADNFFLGTLRVPDGLRESRPTWLPRRSTLHCHSVEIEGVTAADEEDTGVTFGNFAVEFGRHDAELFAAAIFELCRQEVTR